MNMFNRKPNMPEQVPAPVVLDPNGAEAKAIAAFAKTQEEILANRALIKRLTEDNSLHLRHIEQLEGQLKEAGLDKDFFQRHSTSLHVRIASLSLHVQSLKEAFTIQCDNLIKQLDAALEEARLEAYQEPTPQANANAEDAMKAIDTAVNDPNIKDKW